MTKKTPPVPGAREMGRGLWVANDSNDVLAEPDDIDRPMTPRMALWQLVCAARPDPGSATTFVIRVGADVFQRVRTLAVYARPVAPPERAPRITDALYAQFNRLDEAYFKGRISDQDYGKEFEAAIGRFLASRKARRPRSPS